MIKAVSSTGIFPFKQSETLIEQYHVQRETSNRRQYSSQNYFVQESRQALEEL